MLHLLARLEVILARRRDRRLSDALPPAERRQRRIRQRRAARHQFLMDSHEIPLARCQKLQDLLRGTVRLSPPAAISGTAVEFERSTLRTVSRDRFPAPARSRVCSLPARSVPESRCVALGSTCSVPAPFRFVPPSARSSRRALSIWPCACSCCGPVISGSAPASRRLARFTMATTISRSRSTCSTAAGLAAVRLPLRFQKQLRLVENALADRARAFAPGGIQLAGLPRIAVMLRRRAAAIRCAILQA